MDFITGHGGKLLVRITHNTGRMIGLRPSNLEALPPSDCDVTLELPDRSRVAARFRRNEQNPYIGGPELVAWIRPNIDWGTSSPARLVQLPDEAVRVVLEPSAPVVLTGAEQALLDAAESVRREVEDESTPRGRVEEVLRRWERNSRLRATILSLWPIACQVTGCDRIETLPEPLRERVLEVHHLTHVSAGGSDDPGNLVLVCAIHHRLLHVSPSRVNCADSGDVEISVPGLRLELRRDLSVLGFSTR